ncbi:MAG: biopolymer transporter ExbD [Bdellovibrionaceae bacterium]|nr:biopolymer transporter ExbD [Pseudobdellovibrionaceae bacterium]
MGIKKFRTHYEEFELDLTPLLAIIMKLVPVLVISSSFLQLTQIETDLPQVVKQAIEDQNKNPDKLAKIKIIVDDSKTMNVVVTKDDATDTSSIPAKGDALNLEALNSKLVEIKKKNPYVFKIELAPSDSMSYSEIVTILDGSRKSNNSDEFIFVDPKTGKEVKTDFLFPEIVFNNIFQ